jgi:hypothetical protein
MKKKPESVREITLQDREKEIHSWASAGVAAMLVRVRSVCITEYQWKIDALRRG